MDGLDWDGSHITNTSTLLRGNHQVHDLEESWLVSNSGSSAFIPTQELLKVQTSHAIMNSNTERASNSTQIAYQQNPCVLDSVYVMPTLRAEQLCQSPLMINRPYNLMSSLSTGTFMAADHYGNIGKHVQPQVIHGLQDHAKAKPATTHPVESLDCLLSGTNSNTDASLEDDGINSMNIFSECRRNLWNFGAGNSAISSGESENNETIVSQSSSHRCVQGTKPNTTKRSIRDDQSSELKFGENYSYFDLLQTDSSTTEGGGFQLISENPPKPKKQRSDSKRPRSSNINFQQPTSTSVSASSIEESDPEVIAQMKEMIYRAAAFRPVNLGLDMVERPKRKNARISSDPQTVAARQRRERISERIRVLQRLVPGGSKMDTASMLDEAANYLKFLRSQVKALENLGQKIESMSNSITPTSFAFSFNPSFPMQTHHHVPLRNPNHVHQPHS